MTVQSYRVLRDIRRAQNNEGDIINVDYDKCAFLRVIDAGESFTPVKFRYPECVMRSIFAELDRLHYIQNYKGDWDYITVTHLGNHVAESFANNIFKLLLASFILPIAVSVVTTLVTTWILEYL